MGSFMLMLLSVSITVTSAQGAAACTALVQQALQSVGNACGNLPRNSACYGYNRVDAAFSTPTTDDFFSTPADIAGLRELTAIRTSPLDEVEDRWGIALMNVQANVPGTLPGQAVTFMLLGDTEVQNAIPPENAFDASDPVDVRISVNSGVNLRSGPGTNFNIAGTAGSGQTLQIDARNPQSDWLRVAGIDPVWVSRSLTTGDTAALDALPVVTDDTQSPMQAFFFRTGIGVPTCLEAPDSLVVQGPQQLRVSLNINGADVEIGSTLVLNSQEIPSSEAGQLPGLGQANDLAADSMCLVTSVALLEGDALVNGKGTFIPLGHKSRSALCLNAERSPILQTQWVPPERLTDADLEEYQWIEALPLPKIITLPSQQEIDQSVRNGPRNQATPTPRPAPPQPTRPAVTSQPGQPTLTPTPVRGSTPSCDGFRVTSPFGPVNYDGMTIYWDPASNVSGYQIEMAPVDHNGIVSTHSTQLFRVGSSSTNFFINPYNTFMQDEPAGVRWKVQVLVTDSSGMLTTPCESQYYQNPLNFPS
jgi:hypothetical protein